MIQQGIDNRRVNWRNALEDGAKSAINSVVPPLGGGSSNSGKYARHSDSSNESLNQRNSFCSRFKQRSTIADFAVFIFILPFLTLRPRVFHRPRPRVFH